MTEQPRSKCRITTPRLRSQNNLRLQFLRYRHPKRLLRHWLRRHRSLIHRRFCQAQHRSNQHQCSNAAWSFDRFHPRPYHPRIQMFRSTAPAVRGSFQIHLADRRPIRTKTRKIRAGKRRHPSVEKSSRSTANLQELESSFIDVVPRRRGTKKVLGSACFKSTAVRPDDPCCIPGSRPAIEMPASVDRRQNWHLDGRWQQRTQSNRCRT